MHLTQLMPQVMGILNITPDSFSDGGRFLSPARAVDHAYCLQREGADWIDIGAESTRPGFQTVPLEEELNRLLPVLEALNARFSTPISIDTRKPEVMRAAVRLGAKLINDVSALSAPGALQTVAELQVPVVLMHGQASNDSGESGSAPTTGRFADLIDFFNKKLICFQGAGISRERIVLDPGFGFGKTLEQNYEILVQLGGLKALDLPFLVGVSRKSMIHRLVNRPASDCLGGSLAGALLAVLQGARFLRVHDVAETVGALTVFRAASQAHHAIGSAP